MPRPVTEMGVGPAGAPAGPTAAWRQQPPPVVGAVVPLEPLVPLVPVVPVVPVDPVESLLVPVAPDVESPELEDESLEPDDEVLVSATRGACRWCALWCVVAALADVANAAPPIASEHASRLPSRLIMLSLLCWGASIVAAAAASDPRTA